MIKAELGVDARLEKGKPGEFRILVDGATVIRKGWFVFPREEKILAGVRAALG